MSSQTDAFPQDLDESSGAPPSTAGPAHWLRRAALPLVAVVAVLALSMWWVRTGGLAENRLDISLHVVLPDGRPAVGCVVGLSDGTHSWVAQCDDAGRVAFHDLDRASYRLYARYSVHAGVAAQPNDPGQSDPFMVPSLAVGKWSHWEAILTEIESSLEDRVVLEAFPASRVMVVVVDPSGKPVSGAEVRVGGQGEKLNDPLEYLRAGHTDHSGMLEVSVSASAHLRSAVHFSAYSPLGVEHGSGSAHLTAPTPPIPDGMEVRVTLNTMH